MPHLRRLLRDSRGATAIEYGLIATFIAIAIIAAVATLGTKVGTTYTNVANGFNR